MQRVEGVVQHYDWGDPAFIPNLLGLEPDGRPWAELWLGTHPNGPARLDDGTPLIEVAGALPYLLKVLACAEPLSLQTHPSADQARSGFERGLFSDDRAKPELFCALTPFQAFCGVRPVDQTLALLRELGVEGLARLLADDGPGATLAALYQGAVELEPIVEACARSSRVEAEWVRRLAGRYPGDPSVVATLLLNHVVLEPGDAIRLKPGNLHAYLHGAGIELMGASDNVVRAGLTSKPVNVELLFEIADTSPLDQPVMPAHTRHELPEAGVALQRLEAGQTHTAAEHEISMDLLGNSWHLAPGDQMVTGEITYVVVPLDD